MKKTLLIPLLLLTGCKPATWQPFALDQRVGVMLPFPPRLAPVRALSTAARAAVRALPKAARTKPAKVWQLLTFTGTYQFTRVVTPTRFFPAHDTLGHAAYFACYQWALQQHAHNISSHAVQVAGLPGREFQYYTQYATPSYLRCFLLDSAAYTFEFHPTRYGSLLNTLTTSQRRRFFDSITVKP